MPLKHYDPFVSKANDLNPEVNPYVAILRDAQKNGSLPLAFGEDLRSYPGNWLSAIKNYYKRSTPYDGLIVEIGCHKGHTLTAMAKAHPNLAFLGIDITFKRVVTTAQKAQKEGLTNLFAVLANAKAIDQLFADHEISGTIIFFPDPWLKKKRQAKNKLVNAEFAAALRKKTKSGGFLWFKTDHAPYFEDAASYIKDAGFSMIPPERTTGILAESYSSTFEDYFKGQGLPFYSGQWSHLV